MYSHCDVCEFLLVSGRTSDRYCSSAPERFHHIESVDGNIRSRMHIDYIVLCQTESSGALAAKEMTFKSFCKCFRRQKKVPQSMMISTCKCIHACPYLLMLLC